MIVYESLPKREVVSPMDSYLDSRPMDDLCIDQLKEILQML